MNNTFRASCSRNSNGYRCREREPCDQRRRDHHSPRGSQITLDLVARRWSPSLLSSVRARVDSSGYTSGSTGALSPLTTPIASAGAFIDTDRTDYVLPVLVRPRKWTPPQSAIPGPRRSLPAKRRRRSERSAIRRVAGSGNSGGRRGHLHDRLDADLSETFLLDDSGAPWATRCFGPQELRSRRGTRIASLRRTFSATTPSRSATPQLPIGPIRRSAAGPPAVCITARSGMSSRPQTHPRESALVTASRRIRRLLFTTATAMRWSRIGCGEDDNCGADGYLSEQCVDGLTPGETYFIQISAWRRQDSRLVHDVHRLPLLRAAAGVLSADRSVCDDFPPASVPPVGGERQGDGTVCPG